MGAASSSDGAPRVIRRASLRLGRMLLEALRAEGELAERFAAEDALTLASPAEIAAAGLSLFLYRVAPGALARQQPAQPSRSERGRAYELEYLLVPLGGSAAQDQLILETCLRALEANPRIAEAGAGGFDADASLADLALEDLTRLWRALERPYRLSVGVRLRLVEHVAARPGEGAGTTERLAPGVYVEELSEPKPIEGAETDVAGFAGAAERGPVGSAQPLASFAEFERLYGGPLDASWGELRHLAFAVQGFFENGGQRLYVARAAAEGGGKPAPADLVAAIGVLGQVEGIAMLAAPGQADPAVHAALLETCGRLHDRFAILDPVRGSSVGGGGPEDVFEQRRGLDSSFGALYYPWLRLADPAKGGDPAGIVVPPSGHVAGVYARVDRERGVHRTPADEVVVGAIDLEVALSDRDQDVLNPAGVNVIRDLRASGRGLRVWGARTVSSGVEWRYVSVRRLAIFIESSIGRGLDWVVFEPNGEPLWTRMRSCAEEFLLRVWRSGALQGAKSEDAFFVRIDHTTMTQGDIDEGRLVMLVGVAMVKPAEFVVLRFGWWGCAGR
ncbi:MAG TPA: phage tail sheath subtilisin-like domain-containing protein [Planctomycetota bacterium]|nr:phage tail sheath subtilisin-like domain-containing protein [Planctomycetota bacterium]